mmetsp:Transcript_35746/g.90354  ORF Transcript_35746/g.90354 Transcript_35746/m.90354 type:complete len:285 (-) Transcript_35746:47-901(-)
MRMAALLPPPMAGGADASPPRPAHTSCLFSTMGGNTTLGRTVDASAVSTLALSTWPLGLMRENLLLTVLGSAVPGAGAMGPTDARMERAALAGGLGERCDPRLGLSGPPLGEGTRGGSRLAVCLSSSSSIPSVACSMSLSRASDPTSSILYSRVRLAGCSATFCVMALTMCSSFSSFTVARVRCLVLATREYSSVDVPIRMGNPFLAIMGCVWRSTLMLSSAANATKYTSCCASSVVMSRSYSALSSSSGGPATGGAPAGGAAPACSVFRRVGCLVMRPDVMSW